MRQRIYERAQAEQLVPLLVSIGREVKHRSRRIDELEDELADYGPDNPARGEKAGELVSALAIEKRELRMTLKELEALGCQLDADHPLRILIPGRNGNMACEGRLDRTQFRFRAKVLPTK